MRKYVRELYAAFSMVAAEAVRLWRLNQWWINLIFAVVIGYGFLSLMLSLGVPPLASGLMIVLGVFSFAAVSTVARMQRSLERAAASPKLRLSADKVEPMRIGDAGVFAARVRVENLTPELFIHCLAKVTDFVAPSGEPLRNLPAALPTQGQLARGDWKFEFSLRGDEHKSVVVAAREGSENAPIRFLVEGAEPRGQKRPADHTKLL